MDRAADGVPVEITQVQGLGDDALAGERGVPVEHQRHDRQVRVLGAKARLFGARAPHDHGVDELQVAGVERHRQVDLVAGRGDVVARVAHVVLDVRGPQVLLGVLRLLELREHRVGRLVHDVVQDVEAAAVGHAHQDLLDALLAALFEQRAQHRDERLPPREREALGGLVFLGQEGLERIRVDQGLVDPEALVDAVDLGELLALDLLAHPLPGLRVRDVLVLDADGPAIDGVQAVDELAERDLAAVEELRVSHGRLHVGGGQVVGRRIERRDQIRALDLQGVDLGGDVAVESEGAHERLDLGGEPARLPRRLDLGAVMTVDEHVGRVMGFGSNGGDRGEGRLRLEVGHAEIFSGRVSKVLLEERLPARVHGVGVVEVLGVHLFHELEVVAGQVRRRFFGSHDSDLLGRDDAGGRRR